MSSGGGGGPGKKARIEIIPLIDIMFFLLASFMLVSLSMIKLQKVQTDLPDAHKGEKVTKMQGTHTVGIDKNGNYYYDKDVAPFPVEQIPTRLGADFAKEGPDMRVFINADKGITYNMLIVALDQLRSLGVKKVEFAVKKGKAVPAGPAPVNPTNP